jgi:hypothetical protein
MTDSSPKSRKDWHTVNPATLGDRFAATLRGWLTPEEFAEMKRRNETDPAYANLSCASHDFCDANMAMDIAWRDLIGTEIKPMTRSRRRSGMQHGRAPANAISGTNEKPTTKRQGNHMTRKQTERLANHDRHY